MKIRNLFIASTLLLAASCSSDAPDVYPDGSDEIRMALNKGISTRAVTGYRDWSADTDPETMGVIAFTDGTPTATYIYNNARFSAPGEGTAWETSTKAYWHNYSNATALDFFAYMPYQATGATVSKSENTYTLTLTNVPGVSTQPYLVATTPVHYASALGNISPVPMQMDQLMTAFDFQFKLGEDMGALRTFKITKVKMSQIPATATVSQNYTFNGAWTKGPETVSAVAAEKTYAEASSTDGIKIGYNNDPDEYKSFPSMLYMLSFALGEGDGKVTPRIEVTYDVYDQDGYKTDTRTSEILLNEANFGTLGVVASAQKNIIKIKIVPNELHILSDADQSTSGYLVVGE